MDVSEGNRGSGVQPSCGLKQGRESKLPCEVTESEGRSFVERRQIQPDERRVGMKAAAEPGSVFDDDQYCRRGK